MKFEFNKKLLERKLSSASIKPPSKPQVVSKIHEFQLSECKGEGRFGKVYRAHHRQTGFLCAVKVIKKKMVAHMLNQFIMEIKIQSFLNHPNLVKMYGCFGDEENVYILLEYMEDGCLYSRLKNSKILLEPDTIRKLSQVCAGIEEMHKNSIVHRDIKPENIVMTHVRVFQCREFAKYATSAGRPIAKTGGKPTAELWTTSALRSSRGTLTTSEWTCGALEC